MTKKAAPIQNRVKEHRLVKASELLAHPLNYRKHPERQKKLLAQNLQEIGHARSLTAYETPQGLRLIDGHLRADMDPHALLPVEILDVNEQEANQLLLTLDPLAGLAETDSKVIEELLKATPTTGELEAFLKEQATNAGLLLDKKTPPDADDLGDLEEKKKALLEKYSVAKGQLWQLGEHFLLCGDCRETKDVERLLGGRRVNLCFTSPPYASQRKYDESSGFKPIKPDDYTMWFDAVQANIKKNLADDGSFFLNIKEHCEDGERHLYVKDLVLSMKRVSGWRFVDEFCWQRGGVPGKWPNRFKNAWEPVFHFSTNDKIKIRHDAVSHESEDIIKYHIDNQKTHSGFISDSAGGRHTGRALPSNIVSVHSSPEQTNDLEVKHTATFPVGLPSFFIKAFSDENDVVLEPFSGSGTTLIACELLQRKCFAIEISPEYCALTLERWSLQTKQTPTLYQNE